MASVAPLARELISQLPPLKVPMVGVLNLTLLKPIKLLSEIMTFCVLFNDALTTEIYTLSLHDAFPISVVCKVLLKVSAASATAEPLAVEVIAAPVGSVA